MAWGWVLLLKPLIGLGIFAVVFGIPMLLTWLLRPLFPEGKLKRVLFGERGGQRPRGGPDPRNGVLDDAPLIRGEPSDY